MPSFEIKHVKMSVPRERLVALMKVKPPHRFFPHIPELD